MSISYMDGYYMHLKGGWFKKDRIVEDTRKIANIPYFPNRTVGKTLVKSIRKQANLTHHYGVDSSIFYGQEATPDDFIQKYKGVLSKLAKT
ncbi:hypothetical protein ACP6H7_23580 [Vibrio harveyi]|uniref:hypothetical protein n=1 Tax=Vibrio harveyi TaxID=669 RepID=UPI002853B7F0|nr:hypothetical protein [Vibrio harveyi]